jgi:YD repeat-containing protein
MMTTAMIKPTRASYYLARSLLLGCVTALTLMSAMAFAAPPVTNYEYDANGNLTKITDGLGHATVQQYDALNRLTQQNQPHPTTPNAQLGTIQYQYNAIDQLTTVTDPRNLATTYAPNAYGEVLTQTSPDTGATTHTYDESGNLKTKLDAKGQLTTYSYDALNRLTQAVYAGGQTITYSYDQGVNGTGRLTGITDPTSTTAYAYDNRGRVTSEARTISAVTYTTTYAYNTAGQLSSVAYPTGLVLTYTRDSLGRINQISSTKNNQTQVLASNIAYQPFGGVKSFSFGNGSTYTRSFDTDNRLTAYSLGTKTIAIDYDLASRIVAATNAANSTDNKTYAYDNLDRLTSFIANSSNQSYGYDLTGNRTSLTIGANNYSNSIAPTSNRLTASTGPTPKTNTIDNNGSITNDSVNQFSYDSRGRLTQSISALGTTNYGINALGQRVLKTRTGTNATNVVYHYDLNGQQIAETDTAGAIKQETIYLGNIPLAVMQ